MRGDGRTAKTPIKEIMIWIRWAPNFPYLGVLAFRFASTELMLRLIARRRAVLDAELARQLTRVVIAAEEADFTFLLL